jgi:DinB family
VGESSSAVGLRRFVAIGVRGDAHQLFSVDSGNAKPHSRRRSIYVDALEGGTLGPAAWADPIPYPTVSELRPAQAAVDRRLIDWCNSLDESGPDRAVRVHRENRVPTERADRLLLHLFQHQIHHRGQAHAMLAGTRVPPPQLDEFFLVGEAPLRAAEFAELGWTEAEIWRERFFDHD